MKSEIGFHFWAVFAVLLSMIPETHVALPAVEEYSRAALLEMVVERQVNFLLKLVSYRSYTVTSSSRTFSCTQRLYDHDFCTLSDEFSIALNSHSTNEFSILNFLLTFPSIIYPTWTTFSKLTSNYPSTSSTWSPVKR